MIATITLGPWTYLAGDTETVLEQLGEWGLDGTHELRGADPNTPQLLFNVSTNVEQHRFSIAVLFTYQPDVGFKFTLGLVSLRDGTSTQPAESVTDLIDLVRRGEDAFVARSPGRSSALDKVAAELREGGPR